jgi:predicted DNA-binding ribbon-helix-helix protein
VTDGSRIRKRSVLVSGHSTSVSLEEDFWAALKRLAVARHQSLNELISELDKDRAGNLSSAIRVFILREISNRPEPAEKP